MGIEGHPWLDLELPEMEGFNMPAIPKLDSVPHSESDSDHARKVSRVRESITGGNLYELTMEERRGNAGSSVGLFSSSHSLESGPLLIMDDGV